MFSFFSLLPLYSDWGLLAARVALGLMMVAHGFPKLKNLKDTAEWFSNVGFKPGTFWAAVAGIVEFAGGLMLLSGFFTQIAALFIAGQFVVITFWKVKGGQKLVGGYEFDLLILGVALLLFTIGGGNFSLDRIFFVGY